METSLDEHYVNSIVSSTEMVNLHINYVMNVHVGFVGKSTFNVD